jgi:hypothetical protein
MKSSQRTLVCRLVEGDGGWECQVSEQTELLFTRSCADEHEARLIAQNMGSDLLRTGWTEAPLEQTH